MTSFTEPGQLIAKRYQLVSLFPEQLPYEGVTVWNAVDTLLDTSLRLIALDPVSPTASDALDAARRSSLIDDPHVVRILSVGEDESVYFIATEVPLGIPLSRYMSTSLPASQAHAVAGEVASALNSARARGVRHLQITPEQVRVSESGSIFVDGLAVNAALAGIHTDQMVGAQLDRMEARGLSVLLARLVSADAVSSDEEVLRRVGDSGEVIETIRAICAREASEDGPLSPSEFVRELAPWGEVTPALFPEPTPVQIPAVSDDAEGAAPAETTVEGWEASAMDADSPEAIVDPLEEEAAPSGMRPEWGLSSFAQEHSDPAATAVLTVDEIEQAGEPEPALQPVLAPVSREVSPEPAAPIARAAKSDLAVPEEHLAGEVVPAAKRYNPSKVVVGGTIVLVLLGGFWAIRSLLAPTELPSPTASSASSAEPKEAPGSKAPEEAEPTQDPTIDSLPAPKLATVEILNPYSNQTPDNPRMLPYLTDGSQRTAWRSMAYENANFSGLKPGMGLKLVLGEKSKVTSITLATTTPGAKVQWRAKATDAAPDSGEVVAEGTFTQEGTLTLTPKLAQGADSVILWFPQAGTAEDGFRVGIAELSIN